MMLKTYSRLVCMAVLSTAVAAQAETVASWSFDQYDGNGRQIKADQGIGSIELGETWTEASLSNPKGTTVNWPDEEPAGKAMGLSGMARNGHFFEMHLPETGSKALQLSSAVRRSDSGYTAVVVSSSLDGGATFQKLNAWAPTRKWARHVVDLGQLPSGTKVILRFTLDGATSSRGTIGFDNLIVAEEKASSSSTEAQSEKSD